MDLNDLTGKAQDLLKDHESEVNDAIDKVADAVKEKTPDQVDGAVDTAAEKAKDIL